MLGSTDLSCRNDAWEEEHFDDLAMADAKSDYDRDGCSDLLLKR